MIYSTADILMMELHARNMQKRFGKLIDWF